MTEQEKKNQTIQWIVSAVLLIAGLYNQLAAIRGWAHIEIVDQQVTDTVNLIYNLVVGLWCFWHNNNVTENAKVSQTVLNALKDEMVTPEQVESLVDNAELISAIKADGMEDRVMTLLTDPDLQEIADAVSEGKDIKVEIDG